MPAARNAQNAQCTDASATCSRIGPAGQARARVQGEGSASRRTLGNSSLKMSALVVDRPGFMQRPINSSRTQSSRLQHKPVGAPGPES